MNIQESIKARLKNRAIKENRTFQEVLTIYGLERMLYRLSISSYAKHYVLKGGILLYAMYKGKYTRGTADVDLLGQFLSNDLDTIKTSFIEIFNIPFEEDGISFDILSLSASRITEFKKYPGINISIDGYLSKTKISVQIDIGFGDVVYPEIKTLDYPTLLDLPAPTIQTYSKESIIAEKFHAIVSLGYANTRMKDFYDIYVLLNTYDYDRKILREAIIETFENRSTSFNKISAFEDGFASDPYKKGIWSSFIKAKKVTLNAELDLIIDSIKKFLKPVLDDTINDIPFRWDHEYLIWE
ncbi:MAG TPA: nucleotidyl transferase AbiEii/AbiGii toxin family protein [Acholeplasmataceae bacterium]|nr:nucleotidyl transferase AbiEii/AbiGii toxin family protein [Acholeplasmataceae bacterium]